MTFSGEVIKVNKEEKSLIVKGKKAETQFYLDHAKFVGVESINDVEVGDTVTILYIILNDKKIAKTVTSKSKKVSDKQSDISPNQSPADKTNVGFDKLEIQYLDMQHIMTLEIEKQQRDIEYKWVQKMRNSHFRSKYIQIGAMDRARRLENENNDLEKSRDDSKMRIQSLQQEKEKLKMDALKYYKGKPSQQFEEVWDIRETEHKERLNSIRGSGIDMWNKEQSTLK
jgi:hypothetical protein